ncbi:hypothetical protein B0H13DRAFT_1622421 [Mycena leptocephala]|nr:hypothetical protein B0H13DRAFT_1622421 [Mycena leptocephala]
MACIECEALPSNKQLEGILRRIEYGVHENSPLVFHLVLGLMEIARRRSEQARGMRLMKLNDTRTIGRKMAAIDEYKELTMAIASGKMARVGNLLESGLANHVGVRGLVGLCLRASVGKVRATHDAASMAVGLLLLRLGGSCVAEIGHRALGLPSVSTFRRHTTIRPLLPSPGMPTVEEIESNIDSCLDATGEFSASKSQGMSVRIVHQVLMLDEIATEKRARYDDRNNKVVGVCRQHGHKLPLDLSSEDDLGVLCDGLKKAEFNSQLTVIYSCVGRPERNPREYSILFSSDCKKESGAEHARNVLLRARKHQFRLVSVASDGESRGGTAFAKEYMKKPRSHDSLIYPLLSGLEFMNFLTGSRETMKLRATRISSMRESEG